jgi:hypothetical protein
VPKQPENIMRTTLALDDDLLEKAQVLAGPMEKTALVHRAHLLAAVQISHGASLWTRDKRLHAESVRLGLCTVGVALSVPRFGSVA